MEWQAVNGISFQRQAFLTQIIIGGKQLACHNPKHTKNMQNCYVFDKDDNRSN